MMRGDCAGGKKWEVIALGSLNDRRGIIREGNCQGRELFGYQSEYVRYTRYKL